MDKKREKNKMQMRKWNVIFGKIKKQASLMTSKKHITKLQDSTVIISLVSYYYATVSSWTLMESQKFMSETESGYKFKLIIKISSSFLFELSCDLRYWTCQIPF